MRTWDVPSQAFTSGSTAEVLAQRPTLTAGIANTALRGGILGANSGIETASFTPFMEVAEQLYGPNGTELPVIGNRQPQATEASVRDALRQRAEIFNRFVSPDQQYQPQSTFLEFSREDFRETVAEVLRDPLQRAGLMANVAAYVEKSDDDVKERLRVAPADYDVIIRGGGIHAANFVMTLQECQPDAKVLVIDDALNGTELGGQFAKYGPIPTFFLNSRTKPVRGFADIYGLPKQDGDLNSFGLHAPLGMSDFVSSELATNRDPADLAALLLALSNADIVFDSGAQDSRFDGINQNIYINGCRYPARTEQPVVQAVGIGTLYSTTTRSPEVTAGSVLRDFGNRGVNGRHFGEEYRQKDVAIIGCGDTAKSIAKLLIGQAPADAYRGTSMNRYRPNSIALLGGASLRGLTTKQAFQSGARPAYAALSASFPSGNGPSYSVIEPLPITVTNSARLAPGGRIAVAGIEDNGVVPDLVAGRAVMREADIVISATGPQDPGEVDLEILASRQRTLRSRDTPFARLSVDSLSVAIGPLAQLPVGNTAGVPENTASIWANAAATTEAAYWMAGRLRRNARLRSTPVF